MKQDRFDFSLADSIATEVEPVEPEKFDIHRYQDYEAALQEKNKAFWQSDTGILVYRRFRAPNIFSHACRDMKLSLALQLGALNESIKYKADIANYLEPWYGVGTVASAFGAKYHWAPGQAPATSPMFRTLDECLNSKITPIEQTDIGKHTLDMMEYFIDKTKGTVPISTTDTQSPFNTASLLIDTNNFFMSIIDNPEGVKQLLSIIADLLIDFTNKQIELLGDCRVKPGHAFASSRQFTGLGFSEDCVTMLSNEQYVNIALPFIEKAGQSFRGVAFHSCGDWSRKIPSVKKINNLLMVDGAFSNRTDPCPNPCEPFSENFTDSNIVLHVRIVGDNEILLGKVKKLWRRPMKLIVATHSETPDLQSRAYNGIHEIAQS